jgi:hypothetical protein
LDREDLVNQILEHMREYEYYQYQDTYGNDEEAYNDIDRTLGDDGFGIKEFLIEDISYLLKHEDIRDSYNRKHLDDSVALGIKVNEYVNNSKEKDDIEI